ncbi:MAG: DUF4197 domain-containing protein [Candidatus Omnitrophica bacterium]|nr:DUF4197 domain-containing protein [Candidatus Omnitrophota bacterium]
MKKTIIKIFSLLTISLSTLGSGNVCEAFEWKSLLVISDKVQNTSINDTVLASGLRETLRVGIDSTITQLSREDGFFSDEKIKITLPGWMQKTESILRKVGLGDSLDSLILKMNRSAEAATPHARDIFIDAIMDLSIADARSIYGGGETGVTDYFEKKTRDELKEKFMPVIGDSMRSYKVYETYSSILERAKKMPFLNKLNPPTIESFVSDKTLDGIYYTLGREEAAIRTNPERRVTQLLQQTFAN